MIRRIIFAILAMLFAFIALVHMSMGDNVTGGAAILITINFAYWALRKSRS